MRYKNKNHWNCGWKQRITIEDKKQTKALQTLKADQQIKSISDLFSNDILTTESEDELEKN